MKHPRRLSLLFFIGVLIAGSTALGYYYYFVYEPPLGAAEAFMTAMEAQDVDALKELVVVTADRDSTTTRPPETEDILKLLKEPFHRGRVLDQDPREGASGSRDFLIYREPDGAIYALIVAKVGKEYKVLLPERPQNPQTPYLWDYDWTN
jgi:hypothetical protein